MEVCMYCYNPRGEKFSCCGENHWEEASEDDWEDIPLDQLGALAGSEVHGLSSWFGSTVTIWARFDCPAKSVPLSEARKHLVEAKTRMNDSLRPDGFIWAIAFTKEQ